MVGFADTATAPKTVKFSVRHSVKFGQRVAVVGAPPALGSWDAKKAVEMRWSDGDVWTVDSQVPAGPLELKFVVVDDSSVKWSPGPNIQVDLPEDAGAVELVAAGWEGASVEAKITKVDAPQASATPVTAAPVSDASAPRTAEPTTPTMSRAATAAAVADFLSPKPKAAAGSGAAAAAATVVDAAKLPSLSVPKLKALAQDLGVDSKGKKAELVARLQAALLSK
jgi:phosphoglucan,water dikinase